MRILCTLVLFATIVACNSPPSELGSRSQIRTSEKDLAEAKTPPKATTPSAPAPAPASADAGAPANPTPDALVATCSGQGDALTCSECCDPTGAFALFTERVIACVDAEADDACIDELATKCEADAACAAATKCIDLANCHQDP